MSADAVTCDFLRPPRTALTDAAAMPQTMSEANKIKAMRAPFTSFDTDAGPAAFGWAIHPRGFGAFPRVLARYVREEGSLTLEQAGPMQLGCHLHGSMRGSLYVTDTPWAVKTNADGVATLVRRDDARGRADAALEAVADHARSAADAAFLERFSVSFLGDHKTFVLNLLGLSYSR